MEDVSAGINASTMDELTATLSSLSVEERRKIEVAIEKGAVNSEKSLKIIAQRAYFHSSMGRGEQSPVYNQTAKSVQSYCSALSNSKSDNGESFVQLFAEEGTWSMEYPVGCPVKTTVEEVKELLATTTACSVTMKDLKVASDELQCAALLEVALQDGPTFNRIDVFKLNASGQILRLQTYFHPFRECPKSSVAVETEKVVHAYANARTNGHLDNCEAQTSLFAADGSFTMEDPIGTPAKTTKEEVKEFLKSLSGMKPAMTAKEIFVTADEMQCAALLEIQMMPDKDGPRFTVIDTFQLG